MILIKHNVSRLKQKISKTEKNDIKCLILQAFYLEKNPQNVKIKYA